MEIVSKNRALALLSTAAISCAVTVAGCAAGQGGSAVRPAPPTAGEVLEDAHTALRCRDPRAGAEPLIVDWGSKERSDLEVAMKEGIVVAHYDCETLQIVRNCRVRGSYGFVSVAPKGDQVQLTGKDELKATLPFGGGGFSGEIERGSGIDIALVTVGKLRAGRRRVTQPLLEGECGSATHFVQGAYVGAFAVSTGTKGKVQASAQLFGAGAAGASASERRSLNRDGDVAACNAAKSTDVQPPVGCQSALRIELAAIDFDALGPAEVSEEDRRELGTLRCPEGFVRLGEKCTLQAKATGYVCDPKNKAECEEQCRAGNAQSCINAAQAERDPARTKDLLAKACAGGAYRACGSVAASTVNASESLSIAEKACAAGDGRSCAISGALLTGTESHWTGHHEGAVAFDLVRGMQHLSRACATGYDVPSCFNIALANRQKDPQVAVRYLDGLCQRGIADACVALGSMLSRCKDNTPDQRDGLEACRAFPVEDRAGSAQAFSFACRTGREGFYCKLAAAQYRAGDGVAKNAALAAELLTIGTRAFALGTSEMLADMYEKGELGKDGAVKALELHAARCTEGDAKNGPNHLGCADALRIAKSIPRFAKDAKRLEGYARVGCQYGEGGKSLCEAYLKALKSQGATGRDEANKVYEGICLKKHDEPSCIEHQKRGGSLPADFRFIPGLYTDSPKGPPKPPSIRKAPPSPSAPASGL